jgi:hypothetical protein
MRAFSEWTFPQGTLATVAFLAALAVSMARAETPSSILQSLPDEVQKHIEEVRASCREHVKGMGTDPSQSWISPWANKVHRVSSGDDGLRVFTVSGAQAVMVSELELCGGQCLRGTNCTNCGSYNIAIYVKSGNVPFARRIQRVSQRLTPSVWLQNFPVRVRL